MRRARAQRPKHVAGAAAREQKPALNAWHVGEYPVESMHWRGVPNEIRTRFNAWIIDWAASQDSRWW